MLMAEVQTILIYYLVRYFAGCTADKVKLLQLTGYTTTSSAGRMLAAVWFCMYVGFLAGALASHFHHLSISFMSSDNSSHFFNWGLSLFMRS